MTPSFAKARNRHAGALVVAHRGHSAAAPENSVAALDRAIVAKADIVECDVRIAGDGVPVVSHDADLQRLAGRSIKIADTPSLVLEAVANDAGASVPALARLMAAAFGRVPLMLDVKSGDPEVIDAIAEVRAETRFRPEDLVLGLRVPEQVETARRRLPDAPILALHGASAPLQAFLDPGVRLVRLWEAEATAAEIRVLAERGCRVWVTTGGPDTGRPVGDITEAALAALLETGVAAVLVNDPDLARRVLAREPAFS